jgi:hypothetical protein
MCSYCVVARRIAFDDPVILNYVRIGYVTAQVTILATYYWVSLTVRLLALLYSFLTVLQVKRKNDQTVLKYGEFCHLPNQTTSDSFLVEAPSPMVRQTTPHLILHSHPKRVRNLENS